MKRAKSGKVVRLVEPQAEDGPTAARGDAPSGAPEGLRVFKDGKRIVFEAEEGFEFRCGGASLVMTKEGKILIDGEFVSVNAEGALRLRGAVVDMD